MEHLERYLFEWSVRILCDALYRACRFAGFGHFRYNRRTRKYCIHKPSRTFKWFVKLCLLFMDDHNIIGILFVMLTNFSLKTPLPESRDGFEAFLFYATLLLANCQLLCLFCPAHSQKYSEACLLAVNKLIKLHRIVRLSCGDCKFATETCILVFFLVQYAFTTLQLLHGWWQPWIFTYNLLLFEIYFCAYFVYQLLLMAWLRALLAQLGEYYLNPQLGLFPSSRYRRQLMQFYRVYTRLNRVHRSISQLWLQVAGVLLVGILKLAQDYADVLYNMIFYKKQNENIIMFLIKIVSSLAPLMKIFLLALCNKRLENLTQELSQRLFHIELLHWQWVHSGVELAVGIPLTQLLSKRVSMCSKLKGISLMYNFPILRQNSSFYLQLLVEQFRIYIWNMRQAMNLKFLLCFLYLAIFNAISMLHYRKL